MILRVSSSSELSSSKLSLIDGVILFFGRFLFWNPTNVLA